MVSIVKKNIKTHERDKTRLVDIFGCFTVMPKESVVKTVKERTFSCGLITIAVLQKTF